MKKRVTKRRKISSSGNKCCNNNNNDDDMISSLPEPILHHILSFLPTEDAVRTTALSKTWNSAFKSSPVMILDQYSFQESSYSKNTHKNFKSIVQDFCKYVDASIAARPGLTTVEKFKLVVNFHGSNSLSGDLDRWLDFAVKNNVRDLVLSYYYSSTTCWSKVGEWRYLLPWSLFRAISSLESLDLFGCQFFQFSKISDYYRVHHKFSQRKLKLSHVYIDQETLQTLISQCRLLEELSIVSCKGFESVTVSNCPKLDSIDLYLGRGSEIQIVSISAPNLRSVSYGGGIGSVHGSVMASHECCGNVRVLKLHDTDITDEFLLRVVPVFGRVEKMEIERCCLLESVRISSDRLSDLSVSECVRLRDIELDTRGLSRFKMEGRCDVRFIRST
ncbi:hypothetical protein OROGR_008344 [Orobanche gracilis]